jgi:cytochrome c oxidase assembly protein subunit 15
MGVAQRVDRYVTLPRLALASVIANVGIVITGGAVRLTGSGLGCPTWPTCTKSSLIPTGALGIHEKIEFTNRTLTFVLSVIAIATLVYAWRRRREVPLAIAAFAGIPAQAVLGGITVRTGLNPWIVGAHFLVSAGLIGVTFALWWRLTDRDTGEAPKALRQAALALAAVTAVVLVIGTVVTGSGPHAGDDKTPRNGLSPASMSQLHADAVMVLIGATIAFVLLARAAGGSPRLQRAGWGLLGIELAQGLIGFVQYFTGVPAILVGLHMLGACLVWLAALQVLATTGPIRASS